MANAVSQFFGSLFSSDKGQSVLGLDIGSSAVKAVQLRKKHGKAVLETYGELSLGPYANVEVGRATRLDAVTTVAALKDLFSIKEVNITTKSTGLAIPVRSSMVSVLNFPTADEKRLGEMVPLEARKYIPVPISEVTIDWSLIPKAISGGDAKVNTSEVLVVAIHNDVLSTYQKISTDAELQNSFFEIEMFGVMRALLDQGELAPILILDFGASASKVYVTEAGVIRESHIINRGFQDITLNIATSLNIPVNLAEQLKRNYGQGKPEDDAKVKLVADLVLDGLAAEINSVVGSFQRRFQKNIGKIYVTGGGAAMKGLAEKMQESLHIPTEIGNSFSKIQVPAFLQETLRVTGTGFSVAAGLALRKLQELS